MTGGKKFALPDSLERGRRSLIGNVDANSALLCISYSRECDTRSEKRDKSGSEPPLGGCIPTISHATR
jgi:hypothetical protein